MRSLRGQDDAQMNKMKMNDLSFVHLFVILPCYNHAMRVLLVEDNRRLSYSLKMSLMDERLCRGRRL
jgi:hypothetical protein